MTRLEAATVVTPDRVLEPGVVEIAAGRIVAVEPLAATGEVPRRTLVPGFVDLQVNGCGDVDVTRADGDDWDRLDHQLLRHGVTTWVPTLVSAPLDAYPAHFARIGAAAARSGARPTIAGLHLEGPFLGEPRGAHAAELIRPLDLEWLAALPAAVVLVTLAPEQSGAIRAIGLLHARGTLVALGHSAASFDEAVLAIDAGARLVTHCFNGMPPFHHRRPGLVGAALFDPRVAVSLIADLVHVHPSAIGIAFRAKGASHVALVTDSAATSGPVEDAPRLRDGTLAGTVLTMDAAVRNVVGHARIALVDAVRAASTTPAELLGLRDRGRIEPGARADLVALDEELRVEAVWIAGRQVR
jgi:N-acetylglucosamine-6-phosphate deacetylase